MEESSVLKSYHVFLFPFKWEQFGKKTKDRYSLKNFDTKLEQTNWKSSKFDLEHKDSYNEYNYFYRNVREILYEQDNVLIENKEKSNKYDNLIKHYEYLIEDKWHYCIKTKDHKYYLEIDSIILNIYSTGTGVLSFHLRNFDYDKKDDILKINQFGRRLFPPFFGINDYSIITNKKDNTLSCEALKGARAELADAIWLGAKGSESSDFYENFDRYLCNNEYKKGPFLIPKFIEKLFEGIELTPNKRDFSKKDDCIYMDTVMDDRMFVLCWYGNDFVSNVFKKKFCDKYGYYFFNWWYKFIFVDGGEDPTVQNKFFKQKLLDKCTYSRWSDYGTLFGLSHYSLVCLTSSFETLKKPGINATFIVKHMQSMYYKMAELCLLQRASILSYSEELAHVLDCLNETEDISKVKDLYKKFMLFKNKICFDEITAQEQGIEMFDMIQKEMRIPEELKNLEKKMTDLYNFANLLEQEKETKETRLHSYLAAFFIPFAVVTGILGMNIYSSANDIPSCFFSWTPNSSFLTGILVFIFLIIVYFLISKAIIKKRFKK